MIVAGVCAPGHIATRGTVAIKSLAIVAVVATAISGFGESSPYLTPSSASPAGKAFSEAMTLLLLLLLSWNETACVDDNQTLRKKKTFKKDCMGIRKSHDPEFLPRCQRSKFVITKK